MIASMEDTLAQRAYVALRKRLRSGQLAPGARLVNRSLAAELGFSFTPVREAISRLSSEGLVEHVPGAGAFVRKLDRQALAQLYDLRAILEPHAASEAAQHISAAELEELERVSAEFETMATALAESKRKTASARQREAWLQAEQRFHELLIEAARNPWLTKMAVDLRLLASIFSAQATVEALVTADVAAETWREHARLLEMLAARDAQAARTWMAAHVARGRQHVLSQYADR
jgi:DNA-binding GntR family transcriptional regulator